MVQRYQFILCLLIARFNETDNSGPGPVSEKFK